MTRALLLLALAAAVGFSGAAAAQSTFRRTIPQAAVPESAAERASVLQAVIDCRTQADAVARLACFDAAAARLEQAETAGEVVVVDREQVREARRQIFGFTVPAFDLFGARGGAVRPEDRVDDLETTLASMSVGRDGHRVFRLENGQVWRQFGQEDVFARSGAAVRIRRGTIGSYFISIGGRAGVRAQRMQ